MADIEEIVAGILIHDGRLLLCHRSPNRRSYPNVWDLPGGHVEPGESHSHALRRELREELGVAVQPSAMRVVRDLSADGLTLRIFRVARWRGVPANRCIDEHDEIGWFTAKQLPCLTLAHPSYDTLLADAVERS